MSYRPPGSNRRPNRSIYRRCFACCRSVTIQQLATCLGTCKKCIASGAPRYDSAGKRMRRRA